MVAVAPPPPARRPEAPLLRTLGIGTELVRIFDPTAHGAAATSFRYYGPLHRFDHLGVSARSPRVDPARGVYYAAHDLSGCLVEVFGDDGFVETGELEVGLPVVRRELRLLDLRGKGAMRAGTVSALAKVPDRALTQGWSRYFYGDAGLYGEIDGLVYANAHNDEEAVLLYERARDALECPEERVLRLDDPALRPAILEASLDNGLLPPP